MIWILKVQAIHILILRCVLVNYKGGADSDKIQRHNI